MKAMLLGILMGCLILTLIDPCAATDKIGRTQLSAPESNLNDLRQVRPQDNSSEEVKAIGNVLEGIHLDTPTVNEFTDIYNRHKTEIQAIIDQHIDLVWETLDVAVEALPALQSFDKSGRRLYLDKKVYAKANRVFDKYLRFAGSGLAKDLRKAKEMVDNRTEDWGANQVMIDLNY